MKTTIKVNKRLLGPWDLHYNKLRQQMRRVRKLEREQQRLQKKIEREAYNWSSMGL